MSRFALLEHDHALPGWPAPHFDLLLEDPRLSGEHRCRTWRLRADPRAGSPVAAEPIAPHRACYLDYEGPVGGDRGTVRRLDGGPLTWEPPDPGDPDAVVVRLCGAFLTGRWRAGAACFQSLRGGTPVRVVRENRP